ECPRQRADHDDELVDRAVLVAVQEVAPFDLPVADAGLEHECVITRARLADLAQVAEVAEDAGYGVQDRGHGGTAAVGGEHTGAAELHIVGEECHGGVHVHGFDGSAEGMHGLTSDHSPDRPGADGRTGPAPDVGRAGVAGYRATSRVLPMVARDASAACA